MTRTKAENRLRLLCQPDIRPTLSHPEIQAILDVAALADSDGRGPDESGWTGAWDLNAAAALAWETKARKVSADYGFTTGADTFNREQVHAHCLEQARLFRARRSTTVAT